MTDEEFVELADEMLEFFADKGVVLETEISVSSELKSLLEDIALPSDLPILASDLDIRSPYFKNFLHWFSFPVRQTPPPERFLFLAYAYLSEFPEAMSQMWKSRNSNTKCDREIEILKDIANQLAEPLEDDEYPKAMEELIGAANKIRDWLLAPSTI